jgi:large subunit ribosomal protein L4
MELNVRNASGQGGAALGVSERVFDAEFKPALVHQVVTAYLAGARAGTKAQRNRAAVSGGGAKPYRQKGTGRARAGTNRSPLWRGGGRVFPAVPRDFSQKVNRKMYRGAMRSILSELIRLDRLSVVREFNVTSPKTRELASKLAQMGLKDVLLVVEGFDDNLYLAARNLPGVEVLSSQEVDPVSLVAFETVLATEEAVKQLEGRLA